MKVTVRFAAVAVGSAFVLTGCGTVGVVKPNDKYLLMSKAHYAKKYSAFEEEKQEIRYTLKHGKTLIVAKCQMWDVNNHCANLEVGHEYEMKRDGTGLKIEFLSIKEQDITLEIEKETLESFKSEQ
jgi:hypothetical protein